MSRELADPSWELDDLPSNELGPYGDVPCLADADKAALWRAHAQGDADRVPVTLGINDRVFMLDSRFNTEGLQYADLFDDVEMMLLAQLRFAYLARRRYHLFCDLPTELPDAWRVGPMFHNVYEAAAFGAEIVLDDDAMPDTRPWLTDDNKRAIFDLPVDRPLELGVCRLGIEMTERMRELAADATFFGRPIEIAPYVELSSDGPLTVAMNLRGPAIFLDMRRDPEYVHELFSFILEHALRRRAAVIELWSLPREPELWLADDSVAMLSEAQYREWLLPYHQRWYDGVDPQRTMPRGMHLCGDATRHFPLMREQLGISVFDTGFPVDFGDLRQQLGPEVKLIGGVEVGMLMHNTPEEVYARTREILTSGVLTGGRFVLREANNLPPAVPWANLVAMYRAAFDFGGLP